MATTSAKKTELNYWVEEWRKPLIEQRETIIHSEHGRVLENICYRSHWFLITRGEYGGYWLLVKHGGGQERIKLGYVDRTIRPLEKLDSDDRYLMMYALYDAHKDGFKEGAVKTEIKWHTAFVSDKLKKRKMPNKTAVKVWFED